MNLKHVVIIKMQNLDQQDGSVVKDARLEAWWPQFYLQTHTVERTSPCKVTSNLHMKAMHGMSPPPNNNYMKEKNLNLWLYEHIQR